MTRNDIVLFTHEETWTEPTGADDEVYTFYEHLYIFKKKNKDGFGYRYEIPFSEVTVDPNVDEEYFENITWDEFYRMKLDNNMRDLLGIWSPEEGC